MKARLLVLGWSLVVVALPPASGCGPSEAIATVPVTLVGDSGGARDAGYTVSYSGDAGDAGASGLIYDIPPAWSGGAAVLVATGEEAVSMAIDSSHVYWQTPGGAVFACPLTGCSHQKPGLLSSLTGPASGSLETLTASDGMTAFVTNAGNAITALEETAPAEAATTLQLSADAGGGVLGPLVSDATQVYFVDSGFIAGPTIYACPLLGACSSPIALYTSYGYALGPLFVSSGSLYVVDCSGSECTVQAVPVHGGASRAVCSSSTVLGQVQALHVAGGYAYFTSAYDTRSIYQCAVSGAAKPSLYIKDLFPYGLADDGTNLYWTNYVAPSGTVATCALGAKCTHPLTVADNQENPFAVAANAQSVFWSTSASVYRADR
jgi:hypothetical protein